MSALSVLSCPLWPLLSRDSASAVDSMSKASIYLHLALPPSPLEAGQAKVTITPRYTCLSPQGTGCLKLARDYNLGTLSQEAEILAEGQTCS